MLNKLRPTSSTTDHLFVGTDNHTYFTASWDAQARQLKTERSFSDMDKTARESQTGERCLLDPAGDFLTIEVYEGIITTIPVGQKGRKKGSESGTLGEPATCRINEFFVRSSAFLHDPQLDKPHLALLYEDYEKTVRLQITTLAYSQTGQALEDSQVEFDVVKGSSQDELDYGANILIPVTEAPCEW